MTIATKQAALDPIIGIEYVFTSEIGSETFIGSTQTQITLSAGKAWKSMYFTPGSASLSSTTTREFAGKVVDYKFEARIPGFEHAALEVGRPVVLALTLESGAVIICGGKNRKLRLTSTFTAGVMAGFTLGFEYRSREEFLWLNFDQSSGSGN